MSVPTLPVSERYFAPNVTKIRWIPTIAAANGYPSAAERAAGTDLSLEVADVAGWNVSREQIATPGLSKFTGSVPGRKSVDASSITFYADLGGEDVRTVLTEDLVGYIEYADAGNETGRLADYFHVRVSSVGKARSVTGSSAMVLTVGFSILHEPVVDVAIPAAS